MRGWSSAATQHGLQWERRTPVLGEVDRTGRTEKQGRHNQRKETSVKEKQNAKNGWEGERPAAVQDNGDTEQTIGLYDNDHGAGTNDSASKGHAWCERKRQRPTHMKSMAT